MKSLRWTLQRISDDDESSSHPAAALPSGNDMKKPFVPRRLVIGKDEYVRIGNGNQLVRDPKKRTPILAREKFQWSLHTPKSRLVKKRKYCQVFTRYCADGNEETTLAVAEAERKKREQIGASNVDNETKNKNNSSVHGLKLHPGERIFCIGSFRYKMDSSRRTLQRISEDDSSQSAALPSAKDAKRSLVPIRLVIGKNEYVRIGNGNQLVRDTKKRTRILASEKVKSISHTARSRLARKRKYCNFFTGFGKCNKDDEKCPYIHDSSKIAVCPTGKVIPEGMPDCSYFLQGLCSKENCQYRHVHINPNASTCEGFLRGICADGIEQATLAVAEAERMKREQFGATHVDCGTKNGNSSSHKSVHGIRLHPGERIFRIGSVRYKMDSSRRTLQRISDDESSHSATLPSEKDAKRSFVPRRLVIGKDEYVRIGNGNQLVRDPKKRTRILASERIRWSLHTARSRLAKKRKYCQFFTRFGKCNKDDGNCPYIHDSSKIAVCTKFLNGLCFNLDCKLTHKVIPERMPDCSYFLQGLCSNENCPYRHVHVNPNASTCEGFLRGYCADGNECRKKHSYVCPTYEATGSCPQGSKCKLHHPKIRSKGKKIKQLRKKKNAPGRYFGSMHVNIAESGTAVSENDCVQDNGNFSNDGSIAEYISLDVSDEGGENSNDADEPSFFSDNDPLNFQVADLDELIKPIRIMNT